MKIKLFAFTISSFSSFSLMAQSLAKWGELRNYEKNITFCPFDPAITLPSN